MGMIPKICGLTDKEKLKTILHNECEKSWDENLPGCNNCSYFTIPFMYYAPYIPVYTMKMAKLL